MKDIFAVEETLRETYLSYLRSPFRLRHPAVAAERDELLRREGSLYQPMYLEFTPAYKLSGQSASEVAEEIGAPRSVGGLLEAGLFPDGRQLYEHQKQAWKASREGKSVIVTSGTGSGKTECFLAPLLASIAEEMIRGGESSGTAQPAQCYWRTPNARRSDQRPAQSLLNRSAAIRGMVMYPLNALVEDQMVRMRRALDSQDARELMDESYFRGNRIFFGRYTSKTPVTGWDYQPRAWDRSSRPPRLLLDDPQRQKGELSRRKRKLQELFRAMRDLDLAQRRAQPRGRWSFGRRALQERLVRWRARYPANFDGGHQGRVAVDDDARGRRLAQLQRR